MIDAGRIGAGPAGAGAAGAGRTGAGRTGAGRTGAARAGGRRAGGRRAGGRRAGGRRAGVRLAGTAALLAALVACGSSDNGSSAAPTGPAAPGGTTAPGDTAAATSAPGDTAAPTGTGPAGGATTPAGPDRCHTSQLTGSLRAADAAAGQRYATLVLTNRSGVSCRIEGYGGVQLVDAAGRPVPTRQVRDPGTPPKLVTLAPKASASSQLHWTVVPSTRDPSQTGQCQPTPGQLRVIPPDERDPLSIRWTLGVVCDGGTITQPAYRAGTG